MAMNRHRWQSDTLREGPAAHPTEACSSLPLGYRAVGGARGRVCAADDECAVQMATLLWSGGCSFFFSMFKWFVSAEGDNCSGWDRYPTFGLKALKWTWQYDWSMTYVGVGALHALCRHCCV